MISSACTNVDLLVLMLYYSYGRCYQWEKYFSQLPVKNYFKIKIKTFNAKPFKRDYVLHIMHVFHGVSPNTLPGKLPISCDHSDHLITLKSLSPTSLSPRVHSNGSSSLSGTSTWRMHRNLRCNNGPFEFICLPPLPPKTCFSSRVSYLSVPSLLCHTSKSLTSYLLFTPTCAQSMTNPPPNYFLNSPNSPYFPGHHLLSRMTPADLK